MSFAYPLSIKVPKSTPAGSPLAQTINSLYPIVVGGKIDFPPGLPGPAGLLHVRLTSRGMPIWPFTGEFVAGNAGDTFQWTGYQRLDGPPWQLTLEGYNTDDTYPHTASAVVEVNRW